MIRQKISDIKILMEEATDRKDDSLFNEHKVSLGHFVAIREELKYLLELIDVNSEYGQCIRILLGDLPPIAL